MIKLCLFNKFHDEIAGLLNENNFEFITEECILRCDLCHTVPFLKIDREFLSAESSEELIEKLMKHIK